MLGKLIGDTARFAFARGELTPSNMTVLVSMQTLGLVLSLAAWSSTADAIAFALDRTFDDPTVTSADQFGYSVALDGNRAIIGAVIDDTNGTDVGQVHLFDATTGTLLQTFDDPTPTNGDSFGNSVALDGNRLLIGAPYDDTQGVNIGQAHLFDATTGALLQTFDDPTPTNGDLFGNHVALDGNRAIIGAVFDNTNGTDVGQAHLFDVTSGALLQTFNDPTITSGDEEFGVSVALDGNNVLIGARNDDTQGVNVGQAHLFDATTGALLRTFDDPTPTNSDFFGVSVALNGNQVLIGAQGDNTQGVDVGQAHLFDATTGALLQTFDDPTPTRDSFGYSVALDGNRVLIGARNDDTNGMNVGQAHLFDAMTGALLWTFDDPTITTADQFGFSLALDGNNVLIGANGDDTNGSQVGQAHLFSAGLAAVPEPSTLLLMTVGLAWLIGRGRT